MEPHLAWEGCFNIRDLGGLRSPDGRSLRPGALVRADSPHLLTAAGWQALQDHGVRTLIDLRNDDECVDNVWPPTVTRVHVPLDGVEDKEFWDYWAAGRHGTPIYYQPFMQRFPQRVAAVLQAIAEAPPGGVLVHCVIGRDRTGLILLLLLALLGVDPEAIADDYEHSNRRLPPLLALRGQSDELQRIEEVFLSAGTTAREEIRKIAALDIEEYLDNAGVSAATRQALRERFLA